MLKRLGFIAGALLCAAVLCAAAALPGSNYASAAEAAPGGSFSGAAEAVTEGGALNGYELTGAAEYSEAVSLDGFCSNFVLPDGTARAEVSLNAGGTALVAFSFDFGADTFSGSVTVGQGEPVGFENVAYRSGGREVQYRLGLEQRVSLEDGSVDYIWTFRANSFAQRFTEGDAAEAFLSENSGTMVTYSANVSPSAVVQAVGRNALYDYPVIENAVSLREHTLSFERFDFLWQTPEDYGQSGFVVECYVGGELQETTTIASPSASSLSQTRMKQGTTYTYKIYGYNDTNVSTTPCPRVLFRFADFSVATRKGSLPAAVGILVGGVVVLAGIVLVYTFWYKLPIRRKTNESADKPQKA